MEESDTKSSTAVVYQKATEARSQAASKIQVLVSTTSDARKLLAGQATWSRSFALRILDGKQRSQAHPEI